MVELWDDRAVGVLKNTGQAVSSSLLHYDRDYGIESDAVVYPDTTGVAIIAFEEVMKISFREARCLAAQLLRVTDKLDPK